MSKKGSPKLTRWIEKNGNEEIKYKPEDPKHLLYPWGGSINYTEQRNYLLTTRPSLKGRYNKKNGRACKDWIYIDAAKDAQNFKIQGEFAGLAADHAPEIYAIFSNSITSQFHIYENHDPTYQSLYFYTQQMQEAYRSRKIKFNVYKENILETVTEHENTIGILDIDLMESLINQTIITNLVHQINGCVKDHSLVMIWHTQRGKGHGLKGIETRARPMLREELNKHFNILNDSRIKYYESCVMFVDIFILERKPWNKELSNVA